MKRTGNLSGTVLMFGLVMALLSGQAEIATATQPPAKPEAVPQKAAEPAVKPVAKPEIQGLTGRVVETMNAGSYTYVNLEKDGQKFWAAIPATTVSVGQEIEVQPGMQMGEFTSKSLKRTFENILFSRGLVAPPTTALASDVKNPLPAGHSPLDAKAQPENHSGMMGQPGKGFTTVSGKVVETMNSGGYTYVCLENGGKKVWAAVPVMKASVGQELALQPGMEFNNFKSKSLDRTFDSVIFSGGTVPAAK